jgi:hypothetical protein
MLSPSCDDAALETVAYDAKERLSSMTPTTSPQRDLSHYCGMATAKIEPPERNKR